MLKYDNGSKKGKLKRFFHASNSGQKINKDSGQLNTMSAVNN